MRNVVSLLSLAALVLFLVSCPTSTGSDEGGGIARGSLLIVLSQDMKPSNPKDPTTVASYDVLGSGPGSASFQELGITAATVTIDSLEPGDWGVTVNGNNFRGMQVGSASVQVNVAAGEMASAEAVVIPSAGQGTLDAYMEWQVGNTVSSPTAALTPKGGSPIVIALTGAAVGGIFSAHETAAVPAGYYTLSISYQDSAGFTWGGADAVYISSDKTTSLVFKPFAATNKMTIDPDISKAMPISWSELKDTLGIGQTATVTATLTTSQKQVSYQWYLNGLLQPAETTFTFTIDGKTIGKGSYRLDVVVSVDAVLCSNDVLFTIK